MSARQRGEAPELAPEPKVKKLGPRAAIAGVLVLCVLMALASHFSSRQLGRQGRKEPAAATPPAVTPGELQAAAEMGQRLRELREALEQRERETQARAKRLLEEPLPAPTVRRAPRAQARKPRREVSRTLVPAGFDARPRPVPAGSSEPEREPKRGSELGEYLRGLSRRGLGEAPSERRAPGPAPAREARYAPRRAALERPPSPYLLRAGTAVGAVLLSHVDTRVPAPIVAMVATDVLDSLEARHVLIPGGSRLIGRLAGGPQLGNRRLQVVWERLLYPDGRTLMLGGLPSVDGRGAGGMSDRVNAHWGRLYGHAFLTSLLSASAQLSQPQRSAVGFQAPTAGQETAGAVGRDLAQVTERVVERHLAIEPTIEVRRGRLVYVQLTEDVFFARPYGPPRARSPGG